jgi:hypothetical protein
VYSPARGSAGVDQPVTSCAKAEAPKNMECILVTLDGAYKLVLKANFKTWCSLDRFKG